MPRSRGFEPNRDDRHELFEGWLPWTRWAEMPGPGRVPNPSALLHARMMLERARNQRERNRIIQEFENDPESYWCPMCEGDNPKSGEETNTDNKSEDKSKDGADEDASWLDQFREWYTDLLGPAKEPNAEMTSNPETYGKVPDNAVLTMTDSVVNETPEASGASLTIAAIFVGIGFLTGDNNPSPASFDDLAGNDDDVGGGRNRLRPDKSAGGAHSTFKTDNNGNVTGYAEWVPEPRSSTGFSQVKRVDTQYANPHSHFNKATGQYVPTPHVHEKTTPGGVRPATPEELPNGGKQ